MVFYFLGVLVGKIIMFMIVVKFFIIILFDGVYFYFVELFFIVIRWDFILLLYLKIINVKLVGDLWEGYGGVEGVYFV